MKPKDRIFLFLLISLIVAPILSTIFLLIKKDMFETIYIYPISGVLLFIIIQAIFIRHYGKTTIFNSYLISVLMSIFTLPLCVSAIPLAIIGFKLNTLTHNILLLVLLIAIPAVVLHFYIGSNWLSKTSYILSGLWILGYLWTVLWPAGSVDFFTRDFRSTAVPVLYLATAFVLQCLYAVWPAMIALKLREAVRPVVLTILSTSCYLLTAFIIGFFYGIISGFALRLF